MVDIHSHILPNIDDGSKSIDMTLDLLRSSAEQGVDVIAATPHFYAWENKPETFLADRQKAWEQLQPLLQDGFPEIVLGAEVLYFEGISHTEHLERLHLEGRKLLLLEMPFNQRWTDRMISDVLQINQKRDTQVLLAHIERYMDDQKKGTLSTLRENGVLMQSNAIFFLDRRTKRRALKMVEREEIDLIGSDCHSSNHRPQLCGEAAKVIRDALGEAPLSRMDRIARKVLGDRLPE